MIMLYEILTHCINVEFYFEYLSYEPGSPESRRWLIPRRLQYINFLKNWPGILCFLMWLEYKTPSPSPP